MSKTLPNFVYLPLSEQWTERIEDKMEEYKVGGPELRERQISWLFSTWNQKYVYLIF